MSGSQRRRKKEAILDEAPLDGGFGRHSPFDNFLFIQRAVKPRLKNRFHRDKVFFFKDGLPVFSHKDQMNMNIRNTMSSMS